MVVQADVARRVGAAHEARVPQADAGLLAAQ
jgi:hypothetical protein